MGGLKNLYNKTKEKIEASTDEMRNKMNALEDKLMQTEEKKEQKIEREEARR